MHHNGQRLVHSLGLNEGQDLGRLLHDAKTVEKYDEALAK